MPDKIKPGRPDSIKVIELGSRVTIIRKTFQPMAFFLLIFCTVWDGFLFFWYFELPIDNAPLIMKLFPIGHVAVGIGLTYYTISLFINKTIITLQNGMLDIKDSPLPMGNSKSINSDNIKQIYVNEKLWSGRESRGSYYMLMAITHDGRSVKVLKSLPEKEEALYLESLIESKLNIKPMPVEGEAI